MRRARTESFGSFASGTLAVRCTLAAGVLCLLAGAGLWVAQPVTADSPGESGVATVEEVQLTLQARQALEQNAQLRPLNLWVQVKGRIATVSGPVPTRELAQHAEQRLRRVEGIINVLNDLRVERPEDAAISSFTPLARSRAALPDPRLHASRPNTSLLMGQARQRPHVTAKGMDHRPAGPDGEPLLTMPAIRLSVGPAPSAETSAAKPPTADEADRPPTLLQAIEGIRQADPRFRDLHAEVVEAAVFLRGTVRRGEDQFALAQQIRQLPGVTRVILADVQVRP